MADDFLTELKKLMEGTSGFVTGVPNVQQRIGQADERFRLGGERRAATDIFELNQRGLGKSVGAATARGNRGFESSRQLTDFILQILSQDASLRGSQKLQLFQQLAPIAFQESNKPSTFSTLAGGLAGLVGQAAVPFGLGKLFPNPLEQFLTNFLGQQNLGGGGQGFANTNNFSLR